MGTIVCTEDEVIEYQGKEILALPMIQNEADAPTIGDYLKELMWLLFAEGECFNPKNPFGKDYWESDLYKALIYNKACKGEVDEYDCIEGVNQTDLDNLVFEAIEAMC
jgi:hypothetical protein